MVNGAPLDPALKELIRIIIRAAMRPKLPAQPSAPQNPVQP